MTASALTDCDSGSLRNAATSSHGRLARRGNLLHCLVVAARACLGRRNGFGQFDIGGVVRGGRVGDRILAGIGEHVKFVRAGAADGAGIGGDRAELQPQTA